MLTIDRILACEGRASSLGIWLRGGRSPTGKVLVSATDTERCSSAATEIAQSMGSFATNPMSWGEICSCADYQGRWVALEHVRYDEATSKPTEGIVVDADDDLAELCSRVRSANRRSCAILFCDDHHTPLAQPRGTPLRRYAAH